MTVRLLSAWGEQPPGTLFTASAATEAAMIAANVATVTLTGGVAWVPPGSSPGTAGRGASLNRKKVLDSYVQGEAYRSNKFHIAPPAWTASTLVNAGYVCQNAGGLYALLLRKSNASNIAAAGELTVTAPTGTGSAVIPTATDNFRWLYMGPYSAASLLPDLSDAPVFSFGTIPGANTRRYNTQVAADRAAMLITGSDFQNQSASGGGINGIQSVTNPNGFAIDIMTDAPVLAFCAVQNGGGYNFSPMVNGVPIFAEGSQAYTWVPFGAGTNSGYILDWSAKPVRPRRVRIPVGFQVFTGFWIDPRYSIWAPKNPNRYKLHIEGDSITQGANPVAGYTFMSHRIAAALGCDDMSDSSAGGTGFINGGVNTLLVRMARVIAAAPDVLYVRGINNDLGNDATYNSTTRRAAYTQYFSTLLAALPNLIIICGGGFATAAANLTTGAGTPMEVELDMQAAIAAFNSPQVKFLPTLSDPTQRWLFGDGHVGTTGNGTPGNSNFMVGDGDDQLHPNVRYYSQMALREADAIVGIINAMQL